MSTALSTDNYGTWVSSLLIESFMLALEVLERLTMTHHLPGVFLGMRLLMLVAEAGLLLMTPEQSSGGNGPDMQPAASCCLINESTTLYAPVQRGSCELT